jgi:hypothetical protein
MTCSLPARRTPRHIRRLTPCPRGAGGRQVTHQGTCLRATHALFLFYDINNGAGKRWQDWQEYTLSIQIFFFFFFYPSPHSLEVMGGAATMARPVYLAGGESGLRACSAETLAMIVSACASAARDHAKSRRYSVFFFFFFFFSRVFLFRTSPIT